MQNKTPGEVTKLEGWKDIASYFGKSVRAVQMWEKSYGLPVHREMKRVWVFTDEMEQWRLNHQVLATSENATETEPIQNGFNSAAPINPQEPPVTRADAPHRFSWSAGLLAMAMILVAIAAGGWVVWLRPGPPVDYELRGRVLTVLDQDRRVAWRTEFPTVPPEEARSGKALLPQLRGYFRDIDEDGEQEFLYRFWPSDMSKANSTLYCFRRDGSIRWTFSPGRRLVLENGKSVGGTYVVARVGFLKHPRPDGGRIVVASNHSWDWPQQVAILTSSGKLVDEYWHPGWFFALDIADLDQDGVDEIVLGGVNNAFGDGINRGATLVVLDSRNIRGQGTVPAKYNMQVDGFPKGREKRVLLFPEFERNQNPNYYCHVERLSITPENEIHLVISQGFGDGVFSFPYAHVELSYNLLVTRVQPGASLAELLDTKMALSPGTTTSRSAFFTNAIADTLEIVGQRAGRAWQASR